MARATRTMLVGLLAAIGATSACASLKAPTMHVEGVRVGKPHVTGIPMDVDFRIQNPNPEDLRVDKVEYELILNGVRLGRGYIADGFDLRGFDQATVSSRFEMSLLRLPAGVREVLEHDRAKARARGKFYVRDEGASHEIGFDSEAEISLKK